MLAVLGTWASGAGPAEAACAPTSIRVSVQVLLLPSHVIPVTWAIDRSCAVVETGLLLGSEPTALALVGQPIYGYRDRYEQDIPVTESGRYWVAAYARDEAGQVTRSLPQTVYIMVPQPPSDGPHGSHGPLPFYTRRDADFLEPAGEPHYASLRRVTVTFDASATGPSSFGGRAIQARESASTQPAEVLAQQTQPFVVGGMTLAVNPADVRAALDGLDRAFSSLGYPRPGLYTVACDAWAFGLQFAIPSLRGHSGPTCTLDTNLRGRSLQYVEISSITGWVFEPWNWDTRTQSTRSSATYFIPRPPPGKRVQSAKLRAFAWLWGQISALRLNGKAPVSLDPPWCASTETCNAWVTWDFTDEARALAAQGGGELQLTLDPLPPAVHEPVPGADFHRNERIAVASLQGLDVNYPWQHGNENNALTLTFEADCPKALTLKVVPSAVRPSLPTRLRPGMTSLQVTATVDAMVKTCPAPGETPAPVEVTFEVRPPAAGSPDEGGHLHTNRPRPTGALQDIDRGQATNHCTVTTFTDGTGSCMIEYRGGEVSGVETVVARAPGFADAEAKVTVKAPSLLNLATTQSSLAHAFRLTGVTAHHDDNHWGTRHTIDSALLVARDYFDAFSATLNINDLSLPWGGMFDIDGDWNVRPKPFHKLHRQGTSVDIESCAVSAIPNNQNDHGSCGAGILVPKPYIDERCFVRGQGWLEKEPSIHCEFPR